MDMMSKGIQQFAKILPTYWYIQTVTLTEKPIAAIDMHKYAYYLGFQVLIALVLVVATVAVMRCRKERRV